MRLRLLPLLALFPILVRAGEPTDPATAHFPKGATAVVRLPSLDRLDAIGKEVGPLLKAFGPMGQAMGTNPWSAILVRPMAGDLPLDRAQPLYVGAIGNKLFALARAVEGTTLEGEKALDEDAVATLSEGHFRIGDSELLKAERAGAAVNLLPGDIAVHVPVASIVQQKKEAIDQGLAMGTLVMGAQFAQLGMPEKFKNLPAVFVDVARGAVYGVESIDYALTWKEGLLEAEGLVRTIPESGFRKLIARAGPAGENDLAAYLPKDALFVIESVTASDWPAAEMQDVLNRILGEGSGGAISSIFGGPMGVIAGTHLTGRTATAVTLQGFSGSSQTIAEVKPGVDLNASIRAADPADANKALKELGLPVSCKLEPAAAKHGDIELHRFSVAIDNPQFAMMAAGMQGYIAVADGHMFTVQSMTAETDIKGLIDRFVKRERADTAHTLAMARFGRTRSMGISFNVGALKPLGMFVAFVSPQAAQAVSSLPDELYLSTSMTFADGDIRWRGDWPAAKLITTAGTIVEAMSPKAKPKQGEAEEFD